MRVLAVNYYRRACPRKTPKVCYKYQYSVGNSGSTRPSSDKTVTKIGMQKRTDFERASGE